MMSQEGLMDRTIKVIAKREKNCRYMTDEFRKGISKAEIAIANIIIPCRMAEGIY